MLLLCSFLVGTVFGVVLMFMARIADRKQEAFLEVYKKRGTLLRKEPIIIEPPDESKETFMKELQEFDN